MNIISNFDMCFHILDITLYGSRFVLYDLQGLLDTEMALPLYLVVKLQLGGYYLVLDVGH